MHHTLYDQRVFFFFCNIINDFEHETKFCGVDFVTNMLQDSDILMFWLGMLYLHNAFSAIPQTQSTFLLQGSSEHLQILILIIQDTWFSERRRRH